LRQYRQDRERLHLKHLAAANACFIVVNMLAQREALPVSVERQFALAA
jgi:hypothetical protein